MKGIIYKYTSPSNKVYIGQTTRPEGRQREFYSNHPYGGNRIDNARSKYGASNFKYEILYTIESDDEKFIKATLDEKEKYYIKEYNSSNTNYGYNMCIGGGGTNGNTLSEEARRKVSINTRRWLAEKGHPLKGVGHRPESIEKMRKNTIKKFGKDNPNYGWKPPRELIERLAEKARQRKGEKNHFFGKSHTQEVKDFLQKKFGRPVIQIDAKTFKELKTFPSAQEAARQVTGKTNTVAEICKVCNRYKRKNGIQSVTAYGYRWRWADEEPFVAEARIPPPPSFKGQHLTQEMKNNISRINSKPVCQINPNTGEIVAIHKSCQAAANALEHPRSNSDIGKMCNGKINRSTVLGYKWEWANP